MIETIYYTLHPKPPRLRIVDTTCWQLSRLPMWGTDLSEECAMNIKMVKATAVIAVIARDFLAFI